MNDDTSSSDRLNAEHKQFLREIAGLAVNAAVCGESPPDPVSLAKEKGVDLGDHLSLHRGAFVTLTIGNNLRGCIGYIQGIKPLVNAVADNGRSAAIGDPRFSPVTIDELPNIELEISALTPMKTVEGPQSIQIGTHGILLTKNGRQSVFLPQVAPEQGWDKETTLTHLALKAGLPPDGWKSGAQFQVFEAEVF